MKAKSVAILTTLLASLWVVASAVPSHGFAVTYNSNAEQLLFTSSDAPPQGQPFTPGDCPDCPFTLTNSTGTTWTDFHFRLAVGPGSFGTFFFVPGAAGGYDGDVYEGPGSDTQTGCCTLDVVDLNIADGGTYSFNVDMDAFELFGTYQLFGTPTTDGGGDNGGKVPLPGTIFLVAGGLVGLTGMAWRRRLGN